MKAIAESPSLLKRLAALAVLPQDEASAMPPEMYHSAKIAKRERKQIFNKEWLTDRLAGSPDHKMRLKRLYSKQYLLKKL